MKQKYNKWNPSWSNQINSSLMDQTYANSPKFINRDFQLYVVDYNHELNSIPSKTLLNDTKREAEINSQKENARGENEWKKVWKTESRWANDE